MKKTKGFVDTHFDVIGCNKRLARAIKKEVYRRLFFDANPNHPNPFPKVRP